MTEESFEKKKKNNKFFVSMIILTIFLIAFGVFYFQKVITKLVYCRESCGYWHIDYEAMDICEQDCLTGERVIWGIRLTKVSDQDWRDHCALECSIDYFVRRNGCKRTCTDWLGNKVNETEVYASKVD